MVPFNIHVIDVRIASCSGDRSGHQSAVNFVAGHHPAVDHPQLRVGVWLWWYGMGEFKGEEAEEEGGEEEMVGLHY